MKNIINIVNFVRGIEPRPGRNIDLKKPVAEQIRLMRELGLHGTFLLQYDALIDPEFQVLMDSCKNFCEVGLWLEVVQPLVEAVGGNWRGRYPWDWFNDVGFLIGYEPQFRIKLVDEAMEKFKSVYGYYPRSVGSWHMDSVSMAHLSEKYHIDAMCICREQVGMDGYTLQGGYYNQAYYPSKFNMFCPANSADAQINTPVFRMLGSDPIRAYDHMIVPYYSTGIAPTMEPAQCGGHNDFSAWFFDEVLSGSGLCFQYVQIGQENSFGWDKMKGGIEYQFRAAKQLKDSGKAEVITLGDAGRWYKSEFSLTPPATLTAFHTEDQKDYQSVWYYSRFYRANIFWQEGTVRLRDMYLFNDKFTEHYFGRRCDSTACEFRNLPIMDAMLYSNDGITAGIYLTDGKDKIKFDGMSYEEGTLTATVTLTKGKSKTVIRFDESGFQIVSDIKELSLHAELDREVIAGNCTPNGAKFTNHNNSNCHITFVSEVTIDGNKATLTFGGFDYSITVKKGALTEFLHIDSDHGEIEICARQGGTE